jgi:uroporphyrinogen-III synthase
MRTWLGAYDIDKLPLSVPGHVDHPGPGTGEDPDLFLLNRMVSRMSAAAPLQDILPDVVEFVASVVEADSCMIYVLEGEDLVLRASKAPRPEIVDRLSMRLGQGITGWVARHREPVAIARGAYNDPRFQLFNDLPEDRFEAFLSVPISSGRRLAGVLNVQNRAEHTFSRREIGLAATLGFLVGAELERARLQSENVDLADRLESQKMIERATGILQRDGNIGKNDAQLRLQRESQQRGRSMRQVAEAVILSEDLLRKR